MKTQKWSSSDTNSVSVFLHFYPKLQILEDLLWSDTHTHICFYHVILYISFLLFTVSLSVFAFSSARTAWGAVNSWLKYIHSIMLLYVHHRVQSGDYCCIPYIYCIYMVWGHVLLYTESISQRVLTSVSLHWILMHHKLYRVSCTLILVSSLAFIS